MEWAGGGKFKFRFLFPRPRWPWENPQFPQRLQKHAGCEDEEAYYCHFWCERSNKNSSNKKQDKHTHIATIEVTAFQELRGGVWILQCFLCGMAAPAVTQRGLGGGSAGRARLRFWVRVGWPPSSSLSEPFDTLLCGAPLAPADCPRMSDPVPQTSVKHFKGLGSVLSLHMLSLSQRS